MRSRTIRMTTAALSAALLLAACADAGDDGDETAPDTAASDESSAEGDNGQDDPGQNDPGEQELSDEDLGELEDLLAEQEDRPDPNEQVEDGVFRGDGIVMPVPDGYQLDPTAYMQGLVAAVTEDGSHQIAGQAVDTETLPDAPDLQELVEANREQFGEPASDESIEVAGATEARQLRYDTLPSQAEGQPDLTLLLIVADNGDGRLAVFNYVAPADEYDNEEAEATLSTVGFDPDSSPEPPPAPAPAPAPEQPEEQ